MHTSICTYILARMHAYIHTYIHTYMYTHMHACIPEGHQLDLSPEPQEFDESALPWPQSVGRYHEEGILRRERDRKSNTDRVYGTLRIHTQNKHKHKHIQTSTLTMHKDANTDSRPSCPCSATASACEALPRPSASCHNVNWPPSPAPSSVNDPGLDPAFAPSEPSLSCDKNAPVLSPCSGGGGGGGVHDVYGCSV